MDELRGLDPVGPDLGADIPAYALFDDADEAIDPPPVVSGDERRMQVRAYNFWSSHLHDRNYPSIEELDPTQIEDFRDYSVLLDFTSGIENPSIDFLGEKLRLECGLDANISYLDEVPSRSLLSRITDHYLQIIANRAPIGFEAEFVNDRGSTIMYRGILLPYSSDDDTIDFIYGVINWKEAAPDDITGPLQLEVEQALAEGPYREDHVPVWGDAPVSGHYYGPVTASAVNGDAVADITDQAAADVMDEAHVVDEADVVDEAVVENAVLDLPELVLDTPIDEKSCLADWLHAARLSADQARDSDQRTRDALYQAIGQAHDFALVAAEHPAEYADLLSDAGLVAQERAPFTPIVKLVFGAGYDKTRLTEFASALQFAHRNVVPMGGLADILAKYDGGLKGIVSAERRAKKIAAGLQVAPSSVDPRPRLRAARKRDLSEFAGAGEEFILFVGRREADGSVAIVGSVQADAALTEKALRKADV